MDFEKKISNELKKHVDEVKLEIPPDPKMGDYAFPCFPLAKTLKKNPVEICKELEKKIKVSGVQVKAIGPYLNFFVDKTSIAKEASID